MNVHVSGPVLSSLFYEHGNSNKDLDGFLLGKVGNVVTNTITDTHMDKSTEVTSCYVYSHLVCPRPNSWYDNSGKILSKELRKLLDGKQRDIIGWFKFRRNSTMRPTLREQAIHCNLLDCFTEILPKNFIFFLCTPQFCANKSTHTMDHSFLIKNGNTYEGLPVSVVNLGDTVNSEYKLTGSRTINSSQGSLSCTLGHLRPEFLARDGQMHSIIRMQTLGLACQQQLNDMCETVNSSELELKKLREDVRLLKARLKPKPVPKLQSAESVTSETENKPSLSGTNPFRGSLLMTRSIQDPDMPMTNPFSPDLQIPGTSTMAASPFSSSDNISPVFKSLPQDKNPFTARSSKVTATDVGDLISLHDPEEENKSSNKRRLMNNGVTHKDGDDRSKNPFGEVDLLMDCDDTSAVLDLQGPEVHQQPILQPQRSVDSDHSTHSVKEPGGAFDFLNDLVTNQPQMSEKTPKKRTARVNPNKVPSPVISQEGPSYHGKTDFTEPKAYNFRTRKAKANAGITSAYEYDFEEDNDNEKDMDYEYDFQTQSDSPTF